MKLFETEMDHNWLDNKVEGYVDGELSGEDRRRFEAQLEVNAELQASVQAAVRIRDLLAGLEAGACPESVAAEVLELARRETTRASLSTRFFRALLAPRQVERRRLAVVMATVAVTAFVFAVLLRLNDDRRPTEVEQGLADVKLALAYVGLAGQEAGDIVRLAAVDEGVIIPIRQAVVRATGTPNPTETATTGSTPPVENHKLDPDNE